MWGCLSNNQLSAWQKDTHCAYQPNDNSWVPIRTFSVPGFFFGLHPISSPCHRVHTTGKFERLVASTSYEWLRKVLPLLKDFLSPCKSPEGRILGESSLQAAPRKTSLAGKARLVGTRLMIWVTCLCEELVEVVLMCVAVEDLHNVFD